MPTFRESVELRVDAETAWKVVGDLASVNRWVPGLVAVGIYGSTRVCSFADGTILREEIVDYRPDDRTYGYTVEGGLPVRDNIGQLSVEPTGTGSRVVLESRWDALDPDAEGELARMWGSALPTILGRLADIIESGHDIP